MSKKQVVILSKSSDLSGYVNSSGLTVVDYSANWCGPCKKIFPFLQSLASKYPEVTFVKVDVDEHQDLAGNAGVRSIPAFHFHKAGAKVDEMVGANEAELERKVTQHKTAPKPAFEGKGRRLDDPDPVLPPVSAPASAPGRVTVEGPGLGAGVTVDESVLTLLIDMGFSKDVSIKALKATSNDLDEAVTWIINNPEDQGAAPSPMVDQEPSEPVDDEEADEAAFLRAVAASKRGSAAPGASSGEPAAPKVLSTDEAKKRVEEIRRQRLTDEERAAEDREKERVINSQKALEAKRLLEARSGDVEARQAKAQEKKDREYRKALEARIAQEREDRLKKAKKEVAAPPATVEVPLAAKLAAPSASSSSEAMLQIILPDGRAVRESFDVSDTLNDVFHRVSLNHMLSSQTFSIQTTYPHVTYRFRDAKNSSSLQALGIVGRCRINVLR